MKHLPEEPEKSLTLKYEKLLDHPRHGINRLLRFIDMNFRFEELVNPPRLIQGNYNKWRKSLQSDEITSINSILGRFPKIVNK